MRRRRHLGGRKMLEPATGAGATPGQHFVVMDITGLYDKRKGCFKITTTTHTKAAHFQSIYTVLIHCIPQQ